MESLEKTNPESIKEKIVDLAKKLEESEDQEFIKENLQTFLDLLKKDLDIDITNDTEFLYEKMQEEECLARVDSISRVVEALEKDKHFNVGEGDVHYANAVIPNSQGMKIAFSEGQAMGPVRMVIGFGKTVIGFKTNNIEVSEIDFQEDQIRDINERKYLCRHVDGNLGRKDIVSVVMRIPKNLIKEDSLTEEERSLESKFVFRGFVLNNR